MFGIIDLVNSLEATESRDTALDAVKTIIGVEFGKDVLLTILTMSWKIAWEEYIAPQKNDSKSIEKGFAEEEILECGRESMELEKPSSSSTLPKIFPNTLQHPWTAKSAGYL